MIRFTREQNQILESEEKNIIVEASPGSGKTEILAQKITNDYLKSKKPFIALVFNVQAAQELRERVNLKLGDEKLNTNVFIGTIDSFFWKIFNNFRWRINDYCLDGYFIEKITCSKASFKFKSSDDQVKESEKLWGESFWKDDNLFLLKWINDFYLRGEYVGGPIPKYFFKKFIMNTDFFKRAFSIYDYLYVDEYQDLAYSDVFWIESLKTHIGKSFLVGDTEQLIFHWRGAGPKVVNKINSMNYTKKHMIFNHRSNDHIKTIASEYQKDMTISLPMSTLNVEQIQNYINDSVDTLILLNSHSNVKEFMERFDGAYFKVNVYKTNIHISEEEFKLIEPLFLWRVSKINKLTFQNKVEIMKNYPEFQYISQTSIKTIFNYTSSSVTWLKSVAKVLRIKFENPEMALAVLENFYEDIDYKKIMCDKYANTKIMTSASCKGLQATRVIWMPLEWTISNASNKNQNYVCITRAKEELLINPRKNYVSMLKTSNIQNQKTRN